MTFDSPRFDDSLAAVEMQFAADNIADAADDIATGTITELQIAAARDIQSDPASTMGDRLAAHLDEDKAYEARIKSLASASRFDWELGHSLDVDE